MLFLASLFLFSLKIVQIQCQCQGDEHFFGNFCYYFEAAPEPFLMADNSCNLRGQNMTSIHSQYENQFLRATASDAFSASGYSSYLIGYTSLNSEDGKTFQWVDGTKTDFNGWDRGEPSFGNQCAMQRMSDGNWLTHPCNQKMPFVCKGPAKGITTTNAPVSGGTTTDPLHSYQRCQYRGENGLIYPPTGRCYSFHKFSDDTGDEWLQCHGTIHDVKEDEFVARMVVDLFRVWKCFSPFTNFVYAIGAVTSPGSGCQWAVNGESFDYYKGNISQWICMTNVDDGVIVEKLSLNFKN
ncbi:hypothetical protein WR25_14879 isoform B [Diploscapter pachys]|uniref:C-type lectin domain-containing protein n=1 Tax=Diploscapter pachys TaxID=2018661 RepID=A0A2A2LV39_9BILA|nr:hypothetical protein WR25_14879 isoform B [Diploscapter pachys]